MAKKHGLLRNSAGELVLWCKGTEVMAFDTSKASFFAAAPVVQATHIADSAATETGDRKATVNAALVVSENIGLVKTS